MTDLDRLAQDYPAHLREKKGAFYFVVPSLHLVASGATIEEAYRDLTRKRKELIDAYAAVEGRSGLPRAAARRRVRHLVVVGLVMLLTLVAAGAALQAYARHQVRQLEIRIGQELAPSRMLDRINRNLGEIAPERMVELKEKFAVTVARSRPLLDEILPLPVRSCSGRPDDQSPRR
jgi:hypothetical protein